MKRNGKKLLLIESSFPGGDLQFEDRDTFSHVINSTSLVEAF